MKQTKLASLALACALAGTSVTAGSLADPVVEPAVIVEDATSSSSGTALVVALAHMILVPILN